MQRTVTNRAIYFMDRHGPRLPDRARRRLGAVCFVAVEDLESRAYVVKYPIDDYVYRLSLAWVGVGIRHDDDFLVIQDTRERQYSLLEHGDAEGTTVAGRRDRPEIEPAVAQRGTGTADSSELGNLLVEETGLVEPR